MSLSRSEQARVNGAKSRGPKTAEGKARSSMNALKHGLYSKHPVRLFFESSEAYALLVQTCVAQFRPATEAEHDLVERIAALKHEYKRTQLAYTTYLERLLRYSNSKRLKVPPTGNPFDTLVAAEEEALARSRYLNHCERRLSRLLIDEARLTRLLKTYKRDFPPAALEQDPAPKPQPNVTPIDETVETFLTIDEPDFFPKPINKSTTSPEQTAWESNPAIRALYPQQPATNHPHNPPIPHPEAA